MGQIRRKYTKEEKLEIIKLSLDKEQNIKSLAERFEISAGTIYNWRNKYFKYNKDAFPGHGNKLETDHERELSKLRKELKEAKLERDILKKAVGIFSKNDKKFSNL